jgi:hypothetical protein
MQCSWENPQSVLSLKKGANRRHDMLHTEPVVGSSTALEESLDLGDLQLSQTAWILIKFKELQKASEPAHMRGDGAYQQSSDIA